MDKALERSISRAKIGIMQKTDTVFFSVLCSSLEVIIDDSIGTAATDGERLLIDPNFWNVLDLEERIFLLAHETMHVAYLHPLRREERDPVVFNHAADYVINLELHKRGFKVIGDLTSRGINFKGALLNHKFDGWSTEKIYNHLIENKIQLPVDMPDLLPPGKDKSVDPAQVEASIQRKIARAVMSADLNESGGSVPDTIRRYLEHIRKPKVNWLVVLKRFVNQLTQVNYSWRKRNRRYENIMPTLQGNGLGRIDFAIDTSGSISQNQFTQLISEVHSVLRMLQPKEIGVYQFDHALRGSDVVKSIKDILYLDYKGGGGTYPEVALQEFIKNKALALVVLTDGHFYTNDLTKPNRPVLWAVYDNPRFKPPFGQVVHFSMRE